MALEIPNVAHAAGVALTRITDLGPPFAGSIELVSGQGFTDVRYLEFMGDVEPEAQVWTFANAIAAEDAIVHAGGTAAALLALAVVGIPPVPPDGLPPELFVEGAVVTEMNPILDLDSPAQLWCVVYAVPRNGEA